MVVRLLFSINRELMQFLILRKEVFYRDKIFQNWVRIIPEDNEFIEKLKKNEYQSSLVPKQLQEQSFSSMFKLSEEDKKEYEACKTEEELAQIIRKDCKSKGCLFISERKEENKDAK